MKVRNETYDDLLRQLREADDVIRELRQQLAACQARNERTYCAYCGHEEPIDGDGSLIAEHIKTCEKHPMRAVEQKLAEAQTEAVDNANWRAEVTRKLTGALEEISCGRALELIRQLAAAQARIERVELDLADARAKSEHYDQLFHHVSELKGDGCAVLAEQLAAAQAEMAMYKQLFDSALSHVDRVFQTCTENPQPILPDYAVLEEEKFAAVERLGADYVATKKAHEELYQRLKRVRYAVLCARDSYTSGTDSWRFFNDYLDEIDGNAL